MWQDKIVLSHNYPTAYISGGDYYYGRSFPSHPKYFVCDGNEESLSQCESNNVAEPISHDDNQVGILCKLGMY